MSQLLFFRFQKCMVALYIAKRKKRPESIPCYLTMLEFKYFEIQLFQVTASDSRNVWFLVLYQKIWGLRVFHENYQRWNSYTLKYNSSMSQLLFFWFQKIMVARHFKKKKKKKKVWESSRILTNVGIQLFKQNNTRKTHYQKQQKISGIFKYIIYYLNYFILYVKQHIENMKILWKLTT